MKQKKIIIFLTVFVWMAHLVYASSAASDAELPDKSFLDKSYHIVQDDLSASNLINLDNGRTQQYGLFFPQAPALHTYNPVDPSSEDFVGGGSLGYIPQCEVNIKFPKSFSEYLFGDIQGALKGRDPNQTDIFWVVQNNPWTEKARILMRPQYWLNPSAPMHGSLTIGHTVHVNLFHAEELSVEAGPSFGISIHPGEHGMVISSPDNIHIKGSARPGQSYSFWSVVTEGSKTAVTFHWILNEDMVRHLCLEFTQEPTTLNGLISRIKTQQHFAEFKGIAELKVFLGLA